MAKVPDIFRLSQAITEERSRNAVAQLERLVSQVFSRVSDLEEHSDSIGGGVPVGRRIDTLAPLSGGGDLSANRTLSVSQFSSGTSGVVPASGGGTVNFLRADGAWTDPLATVIDGSGTLNKVSKWTDSSTLGDSTITDTGALVTVSNPLTVTGAVTFSTMTAGSVLFAGTGGLVSQDNTAFFWDNTAKTLFITSPTASAIGATSNSTTAGTMSITNSNVAGPSDFYATDNSGTAKISFGYGNASYSDSARAGRGYVWRNTSVNLVFARTGNVDATLFSSGNLRIGSTVTDPSVKLYVEGAVTGTGNCIFGTNDTNRHTFNGGVDVIDALGSTFAGLDSLSASPLAVWDSTAQATGTGGGILFVGKYTNSGSYAGAAGIKMMKTNGTDGNYSFDLVLGTRPNGGSLTERMRIADNGNITIPQNLTVNGNVAIGDAGGDAHTLTGTLTANSSVGTNGQVLAIQTGVPVWVTLSTISGVTGTGSSGFLSKWNSATSLTASSFIDEGSIDLNLNHCRTFANWDPSGRTNSDGAFNVTAGGTYNTTSGALTVTGVEIQNTAARSSGANNLTNRGLRINVSGGQVNYAIQIETGDTAGPIKYGSAQARLFLGSQIFTSGGTYTPTSGTKAVRVRMVGAGGGGGGAGGGTGTQAAAGGGGSSGAYFEKWIDPGAAITGGSVTIGSAGSAGSSSGGNGGNGGDTSVVIQGTTYTAKGGLGGTGTTAISNTNTFLGGDVGAGTSSGDAVTYSPGDAGLVIYVSSTNFWMIGGNGGSTPVGGGGIGGRNTAGTAGGNYGGGGGGGSANGTGQAGGAGAAGKIIIEEYA